MILKPNLDKKLFIFLSAVIWLYVWLRAIYVPILSDEVATFFMYVQTGRFLPPDMAWDANNHILNSMLVRVSYLLFGPSVLSLRLPAVLFAPVYFYFVFKTGSLIRTPFARWAFYLSMMATHFILEFFSYSRGYGMSLALLTGAIWYLILTAQKSKLNTLFKTLVFTVLAVSANLNLLQSSLVIFGVLFFISFMNIRNQRTAEIFFMFFFIFFFGGLSTWFFADYSFHLLGKGGLYYGSGDGFWNNTILSLSALVFGSFQFFFAVYFVVIFFLSAFIFIYFFRKNKKLVQNISPGFLFLSLILGNIVAAFVLHIIFGVNYQEDRTAIYYLPFFFGLLAFTVDQIVQLKGKGYLLVLLPVFFIPFFSLGEISLVQSSYDRMPYVPESFFEEVSSSEPSGIFPPIVAGIHKRTQVWSYYNYLSGGKMNPVHYSDTPVLSADYLMYNFEDKEKTEHLYNEINYDENSGLSLMKRKFVPKRSVLIEEIMKDTPITFTDEYIKILEIPIDSVVCDAFLLGFDFEIESGTIPFEGVFVCELRDSTGITIQFEALNLDQMQLEWNKEANKIHHSLLLTPIPESSSSLLVYFWNKRKVGFQILKGKTVVYRQVSR